MTRWHGYSMYAELKNGKRCVNTHDLQVYMDLYFTHLIMNEKAAIPCNLQRLRE